MLVIIKVRTTSGVSIFILHQYSPVCLPFWKFTHPRFDEKHLDYRGEHAWNRGWFAKNQTLVKWRKCCFSRKLLLRSQHYELVVQLDFLQSSEFCQRFFHKYILITQSSLLAIFFCLRYSFEIDWQKVDNSERAIVTCQ